MKIIKLKRMNIDIELTLKVSQSQARNLPDKDGVLVPGHMDEGPYHHFGKVLLEADHQPLNALISLGDEVGSTNLPEPHEEVLDVDVLLPVGGKVVRLDQDLVRDGEGRQIREALDDVDGAAINNHHLVDILLGNRVLAEGDDTGAVATDKVDAVHHSKR